MSLVTLSLTWQHEASNSTSTLLFKVNCDMLIKFFLRAGTSKIFLSCSGRGLGMYELPMCVIGGAEPFPTMSLLEP